MATLPQPLGQADALVLQCLERVDGRLPITVENLLLQLNTFELAEVGIVWSTLCGRLDAINDAGLVEFRWETMAVKLTPAALNLLAGDRGSAA